MSQQTKNEVLLDTRVLPHAVRRGSVSFDEVKAHLAGLPDESEEVVESAVRFSTPYADRVARGED